MTQHHDIMPDAHSGIAPPEGGSGAAGTAQTAERNSAPANAQDAQITTEGVDARQIDRTRPEHEEQPEFAQEHTPPEEKQ